MGTYQLDDLDQHPVVTGCREKSEEDLRQAQVVFWVFPRQLTNNVDSGAYNS